MPFFFCKTPKSEVVNENRGRRGRSQKPMSSKIEVEEDEPQLEGAIDESREDASRTKGKVLAGPMFFFWAKLIKNLQKL